MSPILYSVVDGDALLEVLWSSALAGVGVTTLFGVAILGVTRAVDLGRGGQGVSAVLMGILGVVALAGVAAAIVFGIVVLA